MEHIEATIPATGGGIVSPFFQSLVAQGIGRAFSGSIANRNQKIPYRVNHVLVDARQNSIWTEQFLSMELNLDAIAMRLVDETTRKEVIMWLKNGDNYNDFVKEVYPMPFIKFGDRSNSAPKAVSAVQKSGITGDAAYVIADMLLHVLEPTETIEPTDAWYTSDVYLGTFPKYKNLMTEILKYELSTALVGLPASVTKTVSGKISRDILGQRLQKQFEEVIIKLNGIGEYSVALQDVLLLVRARVIPDVYMPRVLDAAEGANKFDTNWLENESIRRLSGNLTLLGIALENTEHRVVRTMPHRLDTWIARVSAFLTGGGRYREITVADFKARYSKLSAMDNFGVRRFAVLSQNVSPPPAAQVVDFIVGDKASTNPVKMYEVTDATNDMVGLFGDLPKMLDSDHIGALAQEQLAEDATLAKETLTGIAHFAMDKYMLGRRETAVQSEYDRKAVELALAIACFEEVYLLETSTGSGTYSFMFEMESPRNPYQPASGVRDLEIVYLADPGEAIMMAADWVGTYKEASHVQVLPNKALRMPYINLEPLLFIDLAKDISATIGYSGSIGGTRSFKTSLLKLMGKEQSSTYQAIAPLMVNTQGNNLYAVINGIAEVVQTGANQLIIQAANARLINQVTELSRAMATGTMAAYSSALRRSIATEAPISEQQAVMATMESKLYQTQINIVLAALLTRRLGVFAQPTGKDDVMLSVLGSAAFFLKYEMPTV